MLEEVVEGWRKARSICRMRQKLVAQFVQLLKHWLCNVLLGVVVEKNRALAVNQCQLLVVHFSVHLIDLLSLLLR